jgi:hypothetical protein
MGGAWNEQQSALKGLRLESQESEGRLMGRQ